MFAALGSFVFRHKWSTLVASAVCLAIAVVLLLRGGRLGGATIAGLEGDEAQAVADSISGRPEQTTFIVAFRSQELAPTAPEFQEAVEAALAPIKGDPRVAAVVTPYDAPTFLIERLRSVKERTAVAFVTLTGDFQEALAAYPGVRDQIRSDRLEIVCTGRVPFMHGLAQVLEEDLVRAELLCLPVALVILLLVFRTVAASILPVGVGGLAVVTGISIVVALSRVMDLSQYTVNICSLIGFGVAIDYSLFIVSRYRDELGAGKSYEDALVTAVDTAGRAVTFSGAAVAVGLGGLLFFHGSHLAAMGLGGAIVVALAVVFALTMLPAILAVLGPRIHAGRLPGVRTTRVPGRAWHTLASWVMKRPLLVLAPTLAILLVLAAPALRLRVAALSVSKLPQDVEARRGLDVLRETMPALVATRIAVVVEFPDDDPGVMTKERLSSLWDLSRRVAALPHVTKVESIVDREVDDPEDTPSKEDLIEQLTNPSELAAPVIEEAKKLTIRGGKTVLYAIADVAPYSVEAERIVRTIREDRRVGDGTLRVAGEAAHDVDATDFLLSRAPRTVVFVVGITLAVILVLLRSILLPIKAVIMNVLSTGACFGVVVWIFQEGHLFAGDPHPVDPTLPILLFCVAFGMSMDYEVLMLSRMKEIYEREQDNTRAVAEGLEATGGLVTSAAAIMVAVFAAFAFTRVVVLQATGVGLAVAVGLDATLVRALLVPATMRLLGHLNWWAPRWLRD